MRRKALHFIIHNSVLPPGTALRTLQGSGNRESCIRRLLISKGTVRSIENYEGRRTNFLRKRFESL